MADASQARTDREHGGVSPLLFVGGIAIVAFVVALLAFRGGSGSSQNVATGGPVDTVDATSASPCGEGTPDPSYTLTTDSDPNPPKPQGATFHLTVRHDGKAVTGAKVCLGADMPAMQHAGVNKVAKEASGGRYDADLKFSMDGSWVGTVTVAEPGKPVVSIPLAIEVAP